MVLNLCWCWSVTTNCCGYMWFHCKRKTNTAKTWNTVFAETSSGFLLLSFCSEPTAHRVHTSTKGSTRTPKTRSGQIIVWLSSVSPHWACCWGFFLLTVFSSHSCRMLAHYFFLSFSDICIDVCTFPSRLKSSYISNYHLAKRQLVTGMLDSVQNEWRNN